MRRHSRLWHVKTIRKYQKDFICICRLYIKTLLEGHKDSKCDSCGKSFTQASYLRLYIKTLHEGHKDSKCYSCGKSFTLLPNSILLLGRRFYSRQMWYRRFCFRHFYSGKIAVRRFYSRRNNRMVCCCCPGHVHGVTVAD